MNRLMLEEKYRYANESTLATWTEHAGAGEIREERYYDPVKLALATGIKPPVSGAVSRLLDDLRRVAQDDPLADTLPVHGFHFTFLPLTLPLYDINEPLPAKVEQLTTLWAGFNARKIVIHDLRLVPLPSQLLLAGIPEEPAFAMREAFCEQILDSSWKDELLRRHRGGALPAPFWHSTLLRYGAAFLPQTLRAFFLERQDVNFGEVAGELTLARVNYNWTTCYPLAPY
ncbi:hypothetical protein SMZ78_002795 [Cronobacter dublinensis]|nr:hypothetical protein [Cronobacter dublinensis]